MKNNWMKKIAGIITNNFGLKLLAVVVSCGLWFVINNISDPPTNKTFYNVPVEIVNDEVLTGEGKVYEVLDGTNFVNVVATGRKSVIDNLSREDLRAIADVSELTFMDTVGIQVSSTRNNSELEFRTNIDHVRLSIEERRADQKTINPSTSGEPAAGYVVGNVSVSPNVLRLSGPESLIAQVHHVEAVANIDGYASDINTSVDVKLYDEQGNEIKNSSIKTNVSTVNVSVMILATKEVPLSFVTTDEPESGFVTNGHVVSEPDKILIAGRKSVLDGISKITISDPALSLADRTENLSATINIKKYLPSGTQFADNTFNGNVNVMVGIEPIVSKELQIPKKNFALGNKPEGFSAVIGELVNANTYTIKIFGTQEDVDSVNAEDVIGVVDMNLLLDSLGQEEWSAGSYVGEIVFNIPDSVTLAERYRFTIVVEEPEAEEQ